MSDLVAAVVAVNVGFLVVGYALLSGPLAGHPLRTRASYFGLALLLGAGAVGTALFFAAILGLRTTLLTAGITAAALAFAGFALRKTIPPAALTQVDTPPIAAAGAGVIAVVCLLGLIGGFRSSPWLDDSWGLWLPKGIALATVGLDERFFVPSGAYAAFGVPDYPLWWSVTNALDVQAVGTRDVRAMNAQLGILAVAFLAAFARLLWGRVRPSIAVAGVALVALAPEFWRHAQGGIADLPLAIYVALFALALAGWVAEGEPWLLGVAAVAGITATQIKTEGLAEVVIFGGVAVAFARGRRRRGAAAATVAAAASALPWLAWRVAHDVPSRSPLSDWVSPEVLSSGADRLRPTIHDLTAPMLEPDRWLLAVPLFVALSLVGLIRTRQPAWAAGLVALTLAFGFLVWAYWVNPDAIEFLLATSAYRTIDPIVLSAAVFVPVLADRLLR
jgi:hypothetical protein